MFRTIVGVTYAVLYLVLSFPVLGVEYLIGKKNPTLRDYSSLHMVQWGFRTLNSICGLEITVIGHDNVPTDQPVLYVANHNSYFDIIISYTFCEDLTGYIAKSSIQKVPSLNIWMNLVYCLFIDRDDMRQSMRVIQDAIGLIKKGISVTVFPEGTRGDSEEMIPFKAGSLRIAEKSGCPVIPLAISNTRHILGERMPRVTPTHVILQYGKPIYPDDIKKEKKETLSQVTQSTIQDMLDQVKSIPWRV